MTAPTDHFTPANPITVLPTPDWSAGANWSNGLVPTLGETAAISDVTAMIDPGVTIDTTLILNDSGAGRTTLVGNDGALAFGNQADVSIGGPAAFYAVDSIINAGLIGVDAGASLGIVVDIGALSGLTGAPPPSFANSGTIGIGAGAVLAINGTAFDNSGLVTLAAGTMAVTGGAIDTASPGQSGTIALSGGAMASFTDGVANQVFSFSGIGDTLSLADPLFGPGVTITGFASTDAVLLPDVPNAGLVLSGGFATITSAAGTTEGSFAVTGASSLSIVDRGAGSAIVVVSAAPPIAPQNPPCFARGTAILTPSGYRAVETLVAGDPVINTNGDARPIIWVGQHTADLATHPDPATIRPISIAPGALAPGVPRRTLRISPDHAVLIDGVLIPAKLLVNGATIVQDNDCLAVTYHHIELARHDTVLAEGAACETYLDTGNRAGFSIAVNWPIRPKRWDRHSCAKLVTTGPMLERARRALHAVACANGYVPTTIPTIALWVDGAAIPADPNGCFALPPHHGGRAIIRSHCFVPAHFDPGSEDRRSLGLGVAAIRTGRRRLAPDILAETGFHPRADGDAARWTDGAGVIRLPRGATAIAFEIAATPLTWLPPLKPLHR